MKNYSKLPWIGINDFLLNIEKSKQPKDLFVETVKGISDIVAYDQARIYFFNDACKIIDEVLFGVDDWWSRMYVDYYSKIKHNSLEYRIRHKGVKPKALYDWAHFEEDEFICDYIKPQGIKHSLAFNFYDEDRSLNCACILDRTKERGFSDIETEIINIIHPHVQNFMTNLAKHHNKGKHLKIDDEICKNLTEREREIVDYLCQGRTPSILSEELYISKNTIYRHIANIYSKLHVTNRQELMLKIFNSQQQ